MDRELCDYWSRRDPIATYAARLEGEGIVKTAELEQWRREAENVVEEQARAIVAAPWPDPRTAGAGVFAEEAPRAH